MLEFLTTDLLWWHWIVFGIILVVGEIIIPSFVIIWFGLSAIVTGIMDYFLQSTFQVEFTVWLLLSTLLLALWFLFFRSKKETNSGQANYRLETKGLVIEDIPAAGRGKVRFESPVLGSSEWQASSHEALTVGTVVCIEDVNGQLIKVKKDI